MVVALLVVAEARPHGHRAHGADRAPAQRLGHQDADGREPADDRARPAAAADHDHPREQPGERDAAGRPERRKGPRHAEEDERYGHAEHDPGELGVGNREVHTPGRHHEQEPGRAADRAWRRSRAPPPRSRSWPGRAPRARCPSPSGVTRANTIAPGTRASAVAAIGWPAATGRRLVTAPPPRPRGQQQQRHEHRRRGELCAPGAPDRQPRRDDERDPGEIGHPAAQADGDDRREQYGDATEREPEREGPGVEKVPDGV